MGVAAGCVVALMVASSACAGPLEEKDSPWFIGLNAGRTVFSLNKVFIANAVINTSSQRNHIAIDAGKEIGRSRIYGTYYHFNDDPTIHLQRYQVSFETRLTDWPLTPYAGISTGYAKYEETGLAAKNPTIVITKDNVAAKDNIRINGPTYGLTLGLMYQTTSFDLRIGYDYSRLAGSDSAFFDGVNNRFDLRSIQAGHFSLSYRF